MKKILALILAAVLLLGLVSVHAEEETEDKYDLLRVGVTTPFNGNFLSVALGNNISDHDLSKLLHGYSLTEWVSANGAYEFNRRMVSAVVVTNEDSTFTIALANDATYNDGTPITARDYAFSLLLLGSAELEEAAGDRSSLIQILGGKDYCNGTRKELAGFRILSDYQFSISVDPAYIPYFYQLQMLDICPLPISVIAPGCQVVDDGNGAYISGPFTADLLKSTLTNPSTGYISHPSVTSGPYELTEYDGTTALLTLNKAYLGDEDGNVPTIPHISVQVVDPNEAIGMLAAGELDLVARSARDSQIRAGMTLMASEDFAMKAYSRTGLSLISFCAEKGPTADVKVRQALAMCMDKEELTTQYLGAYGTTVKGYYGIGQWMFMMANGTLVPEEGEEEEWADLTLDNLPVYELDTQKAENLLEEAGWNLNAAGGAYDPEMGGVRYKRDGNELVPLRLKLVYPEGNGAGRLLKSTFAPYVTKIGIALTVERIPMPDLLNMYYGYAERDCDMIMLGTNFGDVFDPSGEYDENGTSCLNGVTDAHLAELAVHMRQTEPGNATEYCRRWLAYQAYRCEVVPEIPLYSDAYLDFHISALQNYEPGSTGCWAIAIQDAILSDYVVEEEPEEEEELEDGEEFFD